MRRKAKFQPDNLSFQRVGRQDFAKIFANSQFMERNLAQTALSSPNQGGTTLPLLRSMLQR